MTLASHLAAHPELIGEKVVSRFWSAGAAEGNLPFLFKVLAIEKALSIQTHPDKKMAEALHKEWPNIYKGMFNTVIIQSAPWLSFAQMPITSRRWR